MPLARNVKNAFTAAEVKSITGLSLPMIDYLAREAYLVPAYSNGPRTRGRVRYYSYRDLVVARVIQRLRESGVELAKIKPALRALSSDSSWPGAEGLRDADRVKWLVTDGKRVFLRATDGFLEELGANDAQRSFAFIVNVRETQLEIKLKITKEKRLYFTMQNSPLLFAAVG